MNIKKDQILHLTEIGYFPFHRPAIAPLLQDEDACSFQIYIIKSKNLSKTGGPIGTGILALMK